VVARAKVLGFIAGVAVTAVALNIFNAWRHVSDDDRLTAVLADHCLPYVRFDTPPFENMGRTPGVFDNIDRRYGMEVGGVKLLFDARFVVHWGTVQNVGPAGDTTVRICEVDAVDTEDLDTAFQVSPDGFIDRYTNIIAPDGALVPEGDVLANGPSLVDWFNANGDKMDGLRVQMLVRRGIVTLLIVSSGLTT